MANKKTVKENLSALSLQELTDRQQEATIQLRKLEYSHAITPVENPLAIKTLRRTIAKIQTAMRTQQLANA